MLLSCFLSFCANPLEDGASAAPERCFGGIRGPYQLVPGQVAGGTGASGVA